MPEPTSEPPVLPPPPRHKRRWLLGCTTVFLLLIAALLLVRYILIVQAENHLAEVKANLPFKLVPAKDLPTLWGPAPADSDNAAPLYDEISVKLDELLCNPENSDDTSEPAERSTELDRLMVIWGLQGTDCWPEDEDTSQDSKDQEKPSVKIPPRDLARVHKFLDEFAEVRQLRNQAAKMTGYRENKDWSKWPGLYFPNLSSVVILTNLTLLESAVATEKGHWDEAYRLIESVLVMARQLDQQPLLIHSFVAASLRASAIDHLTDLLHRHPPSPEVTTDLRKLLTVNAQAQIRLALTTECVTSNDYFLQFQKKGFSLQDIVSLANMSSGTRKLEISIGGVMYWLSDSFLLEDQAFYLNTMGEYVRATELPSAKAYVELQTMGKNAGQLMKDAGTGLLVTRVVLPAYTAGVVECLYKCEADCSMMLVALDVVAWKQTHGKYPAALTELPNADKLPRDPFNEKPFGYRLTAEGFMLWSVGPDLKDNGGKTREELQALAEAAAIVAATDENGEITSRPTPSTTDEDDLVLRVPPKK